MRPVVSQPSLPLGKVSPDEIARKRTLGDAIADIARWYDVQIRIADSTLAAKQFDATFQGAPLSQVLEILATSLDVVVERHGAVVTLRRRPGAPS